MLDLIRPFLSRIIASAITALAALLYRKFNIELDADTLTALGVFLIGTVYAIAHRFLDKKINPSDSANTKLASNKQIE